MEIRNNPTQSFAAITVQSSKMNAAQKQASKTLAKLIDYSDEYQSSCGIADIYMLPGKNEKTITVKFMEPLEDMFFLKGKKHLATNVNVEQKNLTKKADAIIENLRGILSGKYRAPEANTEMFLNKETDLAKLDPERYDSFVAEVLHTASAIEKGVE